MWKPTIKKNKKMKLVRFNLWMGILVLMIVTSCRDNTFEGEKGDKMFQEPEVLVESSIKGRIVDENDQPLQDVLVNIKGENQFTDENGFFLYSDKEFNRNGTYITAEKNGYFLGAKVVNPSLSSTSFTQITLLTMDLTGTFNSTSGGTITTADGAEVVFTSDAIVDNNGNSYTGPVDVFVKWINPESQTIASEMPGDLRAIDSDEENVQLATYGMLAVELRGSTGAELNLADGKTAELTFPLPANLAGIAPSSIPLWSFNEDTGYWEEEGRAELQDGKYVGDVSHFSFWNCDAPFPLVIVSGNVQNNSGSDMVYLWIEVTVEGIGTRYGYLDSEGNFSGKMPKNEVLNFVVKDNCGDEIYNGEFGPFTEDTDVGTIVVDAGVVVSTFEGRLINCDGDAVTNGYAHISLNNYSINSEVNDQGEFELTTILCEDVEAEVRGFDLDAFLQSDPISVSAPGSIDFGDIEVCDEITEFIKVTIVDPASETIIISDLFSSYDGTYYFGTTTEDSTYIDINVNVLPGETGNFEVQTVNFYSFENPNGGNGIWANCNGDCNGTADITINEGVGGRVKGSTTLVFDGTTGQSSEVTFTVEWDLTN